MQLLRIVTVIDILGVLLSMQAEGVPTSRNAFCISAEQLLNILQYSMRYAISETSPVTIVPNI